jgi:hypothetical protein
MGQDIGGDGIESPPSDQPDHERQQRRPAQIVQFQAQESSNMPSRRRYIARFDASHQSLQITLDPISRRSVFSGFLKDDIDLLVEQSPVEEARLAQLIAYQRFADVRSTVGNPLPQFL